MMRGRLTLAVAVLGALLCVQCARADEPLVQCPETGTPVAFRALGSNSVTSFVSKLFDCLQKVISAITKIVTSLINDVMGCVAKFPTDFFQCLSKLNVPQKVSEVINAVSDTFKCVAS